MIYYPRCTKAHALVSRLFVSSVTIINNSHTPTDQNFHSIKRNFISLETFTIIRLQNLYQPLGTPTASPWRSMSKILYFRDHMRTVRALTA